MCPVSNLQTGAVKELSQYPWAKFWSEGVPVTINTDNRTVSDTTLVREWQTLEGAFGPFDREILAQAADHAIDVAFLPMEEKEKLKKELREKTR